VKLLLEALEERALLAVSLTGVPTWIEQGPAPEFNPFFGFLSGAVQCIAQDPGTDAQSANTVYLGAVNGGVWKTTNALARDPEGGTLARWQPLTDQFPSLSIGSIAVSPVDDNVVFAGIGQGSSAGTFNDLAQPLTGLLRSLDGGATWTQIGPQTIDPDGTLGSFSIFHILALPAAPGALWNQETILISAFGTNHSGLFVSHDGGDHWHLVSGPGSAIGFGYVTDLKADPRLGGAYAAVPGQGIFYSAGGDDWSDLRGSSTTTTKPQPNQGIDASLIMGSTCIRLAVHSSGTVYAALGNPFMDGLFVASGPTATWIRIQGDPPQTGGQTLFFGPGAFRTGVQEGGFLVDETNTLYVAGGGADVGDEGSVYSGKIACGANDNLPGVTWEHLQRGPRIPSATHADGRDLEFDSAGNLLFSNDGGINRLPNPGGTDTGWESLNTNLNDLEFYTVAYDSAHGTIAGGAQDNGVPVQLGPSSRTWKDAAFIGDGGLVNANGSGLDGNFYTSSDANLGVDTGITRYHLKPDNSFSTTPIQFTDSSGTFPKVGVVELKGQPFAFNRLENATTDSDRAASYRMVIQLTHEPDQTIYLYESTSFWNGSTPDDTISLNQLGPLPARIYQSFPNPGPPTDQENGACPIVYGGMLDGAPQPNVLWIGAGDQVLFRDADATGMPSARDAYHGGTVRAIAADVSNYQRAAVLDTNGHVWYTADKGASFLDVTHNLLAGTDLTNDLSAAALHPDTIEVIGSGSQVAILVGGQGGVYRLVAPLARSSTWNEFGLGLPNAPVTDLHYAPFNPASGFGDVLLAGTFGRGAWTVPNASATVFTPGILQISGDTELAGQDDRVFLRRNPNNPLLLDVFLNGRPFLDSDDPARPNQPIERSTIQFIDVNGQGGSNTLVFEDSPSTAGKRYDLTSAVLNVVNATFPELTLSYHNIGSLTAFGGSGGNVFNIDSTAAGTAVTVNTGAGDDTINVGNAGQSLDDIHPLGPVTVNGQGGHDVLNVLDQGDTDSHSYGLSAARVVRSAEDPTATSPITINYAALEGLLINLSNSLNTMSVNGDAAGAPVTVHGGSAFDNLIVAGTAADTTIWQITGTDAGQVTGTSLASPVTFTGTEELIGSTARDNFVFSNGASLGAIVGGAGEDTLDYSAYTTPVQVNLGTGIGTGLRIGTNADVEDAIGGSADDLLIGDAKDNLLDGGPGNDILIGGDGHDTLNGGPGRDLLIGGLGADVLNGGTDEDILIGDSTSYDTQVTAPGTTHDINIEALQAILAEWTRTDIGYDDRVNHLRKGGGLNGSFVLDKNTVADDGAADILTGGAGRDWFFKGKKDSITDLAADERIG
jgi:hypothetical protein